MLQKIKKLLSRKKQERLPYLFHSMLDINVHGTWLSRLSRDGQLGRILATRRDFRN